MRIFFLKNTLKIASASRNRLQIFTLLLSTTITTLLSFVSSIKCVSLTSPLKKEQNNSSTCSAFTSSALILSLQTLQFLWRGGAQKYFYPHGAGYPIATIATPLLTVDEKIDFEFFINFESIPITHKWYKNYYLVLFLSSQ